MTRGFTRRPIGNRRGFTLLETSMALVIIGVGVLAFVEAQNAFIKNNTWSSQAATATLLAGEIRERTRRLPRHDPVTGLYIETSCNCVFIYVKYIVITSYITNCTPKY